MNIGIYIYDNAEVLDFSGPFEVLSTAKRLAVALSQWQIYLVAEENRLIKARGGFMVKPHHDFSTCPSLDVLIVVGGEHCEELTKTKVIEWIGKTANSATRVASVCTGAFLLAQAGCLDGLTVTTHWEDISDLTAAYPQLEVQSEKRFIDSGKFITSAGISAGIDMSLHLLSQLVSCQLAIETAQQMEYDWRIE